jgi:hypothetical protein
VESIDQSIICGHGLLFGGNGRRPDGASSSVPDCDLNPPLTMLVSKDDAALRLSSVIGGSRVRAGALDVENPVVREAALKAKVRIIDISQ